jgi:hypothetical protein
MADEANPAAPDKHKHHRRGDNRMSEDCVTMNVLVGGTEYFVPIPIGDALDDLLAAARKVVSNSKPPFPEFMPELDKALAAFDGFTRLPGSAQT